MREHQDISDRRLRAPTPIYQEKIASLRAMTERMTPIEGRTPTDIPFLTLIRYRQQTPPIPAVLTPAFCLILQGAKRIHVGQEIIECLPGDFLSSVIDLPAFAQVFGATKQSPYIGLRIDVTTQEIAAVITEAGLTVQLPEKQQSIGAFIGQADIGLLDLCIRLLHLLETPEEVPFVSALIKQEILFHLLRGAYGHLLFQQVFFDQQAEGIGRAIAWIKDHYTHTFTVEDLATSNHMSVSGLHHQFKAITTMGPLQYQKHLRLLEARRLLLSGAMDATRAGLAVGYASSSQFSREYRRLFGLPPLQDIKAVRNSAAASAGEVL